MQVAQARLSEEENRRRRQLGLCLYSGQAGQHVARCPVVKRMVVSHSTLLNTASRPLPTVTLSSDISSIQQAILIDSRTDTNLMDTQVAGRLGFEMALLPSAVEATVLPILR